MRCGLFAVLSAVLSIGLLVAPTVSAISQYDGVIQLTEQVVLEEYNQGEPTGNIVDWTYGWSSEFKDALEKRCNNGDMCSAYFAWRDIDLSIANWAIFQMTNSNDILLWYAPNGGTCGFNISNKDFGCTGTPNYKVQLTNNGYCSSGNIRTENCNHVKHDNSYPLSVGFNEGDGVKALFINYPITYPEGYEGIIPPDKLTEAQVLTPEYQYSLSKSGKLSIKYLDNLPHFLTGISTIVIESMTENWLSIDSSIDTIPVTPGGWLDETYQLPAQGYYIIRIDHNQQLDKPPWPSNEKYSIEQVWIQLHYDGKTVINANTANCEGICNTQRPDVSDSNPTSPFFNALDNLNTFGLTQFFTAPINFLATLPAKADNCSPISFPLLGKTINIECLKPRYYDWSTTVMNIYTTVLIAGTGYLIAFNVFRHIKDVNTPDKDKIEVARL